MFVAAIAKLNVVKKKTASSASTKKIALDFCIFIPPNCVDISFI